MGLRLYIKCIDYISGVSKSVGRVNQSEIREAYKKLQMNAAAATRPETDSRPIEERTGQDPVAQQFHHEIISLTESFNSKIYQIHTLSFCTRLTSSFRGFIHKLQISVAIKFQIISQEFLFANLCASVCLRWIYFFFFIAIVRFSNQALMDSLFLLSTGDCKFILKIIL